MRDRPFGETRQIRRAVTRDRGTHPIGILIFSPLFMAVCIHALVTGRPAFYGHRRVGRFGRPFSCMKFRTMVINADEVLQQLLARDQRAQAEWNAFS